MPQDAKKTSSRYPGVTRQPDGKVLIRWTVRLGGRDGRIVNRKATLPASTTLADAAKIRAQKLAATVDKVKGKALSKRESFRAMTLTAYAQRWLELRASGFKSATTLENWIDALEHHILPVLGSLRIASITRDDVQGWVSAAESKTFVPRTAKAREVKQPDGTTITVEPAPRLYAKASIDSWWTKVRQILKDAAADADVPDPTVRARPPKTKGRKTIRERRTLTEDELRSLFDAIPTEWHVEAVVLALAGMRPSELYALEWDRDVDLERGELRLDHGQVRGILSDPKGEPRIVPLGPVVTRLLREHRRTMIRDQRAGVESGLVFPASERREPRKDEAGAPIPWATPAEGWYRQSGALLKTLERASRAVGLIRVTPNVLRRTWISLQVKGGVDRLVLRPIVGHVDEEMTELYTHVHMEQRRAAVQNLEGKVMSLVMSPNGTSHQGDTGNPRKSGG